MRINKKQLFSPMTVQFILSDFMSRRLLQLDPVTKYLQIIIDPWSTDHHLYNYQMSATFPLSLPLPAHNKQLECVGLLLLTGCPSCPECLQELRVTAAAESRSRSKPLLCTLVCGEHNNDDDDVPRNGTHSIGAIFLYLRVFLKTIIILMS